ncbi:MAG: class B sortase [Oscillospiraceae bacterium]|nr:class B sortase [Oscillospiraceae bacterium]
MKSKWPILLIILFALLFVASAVLLIIYYAQSVQQAKIYDELAEMMELPPPSTEEITEDDYITVQAPDASSVSILPEFQALYAENPDIAGWICIADTPLNYPVMYKPAKKDFYLRRNFYGEKARQGCLYIQETCSVFPASDQIIIFGHNMKDGSMFACLKEYLKKDFFEAHPTVTFNTLTERGEYEIFSVFTISMASDNRFPFYKYVSLPDEDTFRSVIDTCKGMSQYDTGVMPQFGDEILTLVTCEYSQEDGRLVVMARKIN